MLRTSPLTFVKNEIIGSENTFHAWCVLAAAAGILAMSFYLSSPTVSFHGVADSREPHVNFEFPVEVKAVYVLPGQKVKKGDLLLELDQFEIEQKLRELDGKVAKLKAEKSVRDQMNNAVGNGGGQLRDDPLALEIRELDVERAYLAKRRDSLFVFAEIDGVVNSVNFRKGERAKAFDPLVTLSAESPTFVQGFIHERLNSGVKIGSVVKVAALSGSGLSVNGKVVSMGSRFIQIPERLAAANHGTNAIWGREVTIEIPENSGLLLGERVVISPRLSFFPSLLAQAEPETPAKASQMEQPSPLLIPPALASRTRLEASGAVFLPDIRKFLLVSDDTDHQHSPWLFLMSEGGELSDHPVVIPGLTSLDDAESISSEGGYVYVLESLREGSGQRLIRTSRNGLQFSSAETVDMGGILRHALRNSQAPSLRAISQEQWDHLEVEAHAVRGGNLYLALKSPKGRGGTSIILRMIGLNDLFLKRGFTPAIEVWKEIRLSESGEALNRITDLTFVNNTAYFTTTCKHQTCGAFWSLAEDDAGPRLVREYAEERPEGVSFDPAKNVFLLTFDLAKDGSKYQLLSGPSTSGL